MRARGLTRRVARLPVGVTSTAVAALDLSRPSDASHAPLPSKLSIDTSLSRLTSPTVMADKEATVYIVDVGKSMGEKHGGRNETDLEWCMKYVWDKITTTVRLCDATLSLLRR